MVHVLHQVLTDEKNNLCFFTNEIIFSKLNNSFSNKNSFDCLIKESFENSKAFHGACLKKIEKGSFDLIIFNTIDEDYDLVWKLIKEINLPLVVTLHNINTWLKPKFLINRDSLKNNRYRKKILKKTSAIIVCEELLKNYITKNNLYKKEIISIPYTLTESFTAVVSSKKLNIAIPGAIDGNMRRNYDFCINTLNEAFLLGYNICVTFIGEVIGHEGQRIKKSIEQMQQKGYDVRHVFDKSSNAVFDEEMKKASIVFMPVNINTKYEKNKEIYGETKITGVLYDMMRFKKPGIVPINFQVPPTISSSVLNYAEKDDFLVTLKKLTENNHMLSEITEKAERNSEYYSVDSIKKRVLRLLLKMSKS